MPLFRAAGRAFTLTEMLVALAVLVLALAVVTNVFSVTTKTAASSAAIADVEGLVRNFAYQLEQDLEHCDPSQSILVIHGRTQAAARTEELRQAGQYYRELIGDPNLAASSGFNPLFDAPADPDTNAYSDPRADILMFFTNRPSVSKAPATAYSGSLTPFQEKLQRGARVAPIQVVYGHAALDTAVPSGNTWVFANDLRNIETDDGTVLSPLPADRWHLSRRATLLGEPVATQWQQFPAFSNDDFDRIVRCYSDPADAHLAGDAVVFSLHDYVELFAPNVHTGGTAWGRARRSPYQFPVIAGISNLGLPPQLRWENGDAAWVDQVLYYHGNQQYHHVATVIEQPPAALQDNLGVHLVPGCAWFQVEFLLPEDPRNGLDSPLSDQRRDTPRWVEVEPTQTYVFVPDTKENREWVESEVYQAGVLTGTPLRDSRLARFMQVIPPNGAIPGSAYAGANRVANRRVRMWPYAIRVTVRVFDQRGRLETPIVRSVVHRFD